MSEDHEWVPETTLALTAGWPPSVAIDGDTAIVGVIRTYAGIDSGYAAILEHDAAGWRTIQELRPSAPRSWELFGGDVAISGELAVVGASSCGSDPPRPGEAFVFRRHQGVWSEQARLRARDAAAGDCFAANVAISGNTIAVAGPARTYLFDCVSDVWSDAGHLEGRGPIAIAGDRMLLGNEYGAGTEVRVFDRVDGGWGQSEALRASNPDDNRFGYSVALSGRNAVVGAPTLYVPPQGMPRCRPGAAYAFREAGGAWTEEARFDGGAAIACLGMSTAASGDLVAVGGPMQAFVYARRAEGWYLDGTWRYTGAEYAANVEVALSGDVLVTAWPYVSTTAGPLHTSVSFYRAKPR